MAYLVECRCQWCGFEATRWEMLELDINEEQVDIWVCDVCALAWRTQD